MEFTLDNRPEGINLKTSVLAFGKVANSHAGLSKATVVLVEGKFTVRLHTHYKVDNRVFYIDVPETSIEGLYNATSYDKLLDMVLASVKESVDADKPMVESYHMDKRTIRVYPSVPTGLMVN